VIEDGTNGLLVPPADSAALARAVAGLIDHPERREQLGMKGRETVLDKFDPEQNARRLAREFLNDER
jgi:glycosyltransferase involved in cell wall biosynthesis